MLIFVFYIENLQFNKYLKILANDSVIQLRFAHLVNSRRAKRLHSLFLSLLYFLFLCSSRSLSFPAVSLPQAALLIPRKTLKIAKSLTRKRIRGYLRRRSCPFPPWCPLFLLGPISHRFISSSPLPPLAIFLPLRVLPSPRASPGMIPLIRHEQVRRRFDKRNAAPIAAALRGN